MPLTSSRSPDGDARFLFSLWPPRSRWRPRLSARLRRSRCTRASAATGPQLPALRRRQGQGEGEPVARHPRLHQHPGGGPPFLNFPAGDEGHRSRCEDGERRARRRSWAPRQAERVLHRSGRRGRREVRPADGQRQERERDPLRRLLRRRAAVLRDAQGNEAGHRRSRSRRRCGAEERLLPERQPDERARALRHLHEEVPAEGEDGGDRLSDRPGCDHGGAGAPEGHASRSGGR